VSVTGKVKNRVIPLRQGTKLLERADLKGEALELLPANDPRIAEVLKLAKPRPHWPKDFALNHSHCLKGHPKKS
jgi:hypothetical protein